MSSEYHATQVAAYFDELAEAEWTRLEKNPEAEVNFAVHAHYLRRYLQPGWRVLEVGAGAGRFTIEIARLGCSVVVTDVSSTQLELNLAKVDEAGLSGAVESRLLLDVVNMETLEDDAFDAVVCYGGPLSYVMNRRDEGLRECVRVTKRGGPLLISVMSLWGSVHKGLSFVLSVPKASNDAIIASGDITSEAIPGHSHWCHAFRGTEFRAFLLEAGLSIDALSAATCLSTGWSDRLVGIRENEDRWNELLEMEIAACAEPGCVEAGPHIIGVALKPNTE